MGGRRPFIWSLNRIHQQTSERSKSKHDPSTTNGDTHQIDKRGLTEKTHQAPAALSSSLDTKTPSLKDPILVDVDFSPIRSRAESKVIILHGRVAEAAGVLDERLC
jgi:hypothetical protein